MFAWVAPGHMHQARDPTFTFNGMHHVLYLFPLSNHSSEDAGPPPAKAWLARARTVMARVPVALTASNARSWLRGRPCASGLLSTCAVDHFLEGGVR